MAEAGGDRQDKLSRSGWEGERWDGRMDRAMWWDFPRDPALAPKVLSNSLCFTEIKCTGTGQASNLSLIVLLIAQLYYWAVSVVNAKKLRHHKMKAGFKNQILTTAFMSE